MSVPPGGVHFLYTWVIYRGNARLVDCNGQSWSRPKARRPASLTAGAKEALAVSFALPFGDLVDAHRRRQQKRDVRARGDRDPVRVPDGEPPPGDLRHGRALAVHRVLVVGDVALDVVDRPAHDLDRVALVEEREQRLCDR